MPDTGAPWNLPYPAPSDLVRNGPAQFEALADAVADGLTSSLIITSQVITTTNFTTSSATFVDLTGVTITVTPSAATNRFLLMFTANNQNSSTNSNYFQFQRDSTLLFEEVEDEATAATAPSSVAMMFDEEATNTTARTYKVMARRDGGTLTVLNSAFVVIEYAV
jgi:hypothetical protein